MPIPASAVEHRATKQGRVVHPPCGAEWGGYKTAHCAACCRTFSTPANFDKHRSRAGKCPLPTDVGMVLNARSYPCWGMPGVRDDDE